MREVRERQGAGAAPRRRFVAAVALAVLAASIVPGIALGAPARAVSSSSWATVPASKLGAHLKPAAATSAPVAYVPSARHSRVVIVLLGGTTWADLRLPQAASLRRVMMSGWLANLDCATAGDERTIARALVSMGAAARADAGPEAGLAYVASDQFENGNAAEAYVRRTGHLPGDAEVLHLGIASIDRVNAADPSQIRPGLLGTVVESLGLKTAVLGSADTGAGPVSGSRHREAAALAMDQYGRVDYGAPAESEIVPAPEMAYGVRSNASEMLMRYSLLPDDTGLVVIDFGDTIRAARYASQAQPAAQRFLRARAMDSAGDFVTRLAQLSSGRDSIIIMSPEARDGGPGPAPMTPFSILVPGTMPGYATSGTTHRAGMVTGIDIVRTVRERLTGSDDPKPDIPGRPITRAAGDEQVVLGGLAAESRRAVAVDGIRVSVVIGWALVATVSSLIALGLVLAVPTRENSFRLAEALLLFAVALPLSAFVAGWVSTLSGAGRLGMQLLSPPSYVVVVVAPAVALAAALALTRISISRQFAVVLAATVGVLAVDQLVGAPASVDTIFGYSPIAGGRYYGMGNDAWAIAFACVALVLGIWLDWTPRSWLGRRAIVASAFGALALVVGLPVLGANLGGFVSVLAGLLAMWVTLSQKRYRAWVLPAAVGAILAAAGLLVGLDGLRAPSAGTHYAGMARMLADGNLSSLSVIVSRKIALNLAVFNSTPFSWLLLPAVALFLIDAHRARGLLSGFLAQRPGLSAALTAILAAGGTALFIEDTRIAIPAHMLGIAGPVVLGLMLAAARWRLTTLQP
jgi:hypothetical protein